MLRISLWAREHIYLARAIIIIIKGVLAFLAFFISKILLKNELQIPGVLPAVSVLIFLLSIFIYPAKKPGNKSFYSSFAFRKTCDFTLGAASFVMLICIFGQTNKKGSFSTFNTAYAASGTLIKKHTPPTAEEILKSLEDGRDKKTLTKKEKRVLKLEFKKQLKTWTVATLTGDKEKKGNAGLIILAIIGALGLLFLLTALVCNLSCNGADGAAIAVGILGLAALIWGLIAIIRRIERGPKHKKPKPEKG